MLPGPTEPGAPFQGPRGTCRSRETSSPWVAKAGNWPVLWPTQGPLGQYSQATSGPLKHHLLEALCVAHNTFCNLPDYRAPVHLQPKAMHYQGQEGFSLFFLNFLYCNKIQVTRSKGLFLGLRICFLVILCWLIQLYKSRNRIFQIVDSVTNCFSCLVPVPLESVRWSFPKSLLGFLFGLCCSCRSEWEDLTF